MNEVKEKKQFSKARLGTLCADAVCSSMDERFWQQIWQKKWQQ